VLFSSYEFIFLFLPITVWIYFWLAKKRYTKASTAWLVLASLFFYGYWNVKYVPLLLGSILFNYGIGSVIERAQNKKMFLTVGITGNLALLGYFKYTGFFLSSLNQVFLLAIPVPHIVLPLGISFFTFTQTAYLIDAYRGETKRYSFLTYSLFVTIFPHLIAGPIINHKDMIPQFSRLRNFVIDYENVAKGGVIFIIGLFKKVVIADSLAPWAALAFNNADQLTMLEAWIGAISYTFQLYFDFSGYSEMAMGLGLLFNLRFPVNFNSPYKATSIIEFWRRWHMTLSAFLKDYLYIPLGGNRHGEFKKMRNLLITMLLGGLWHGAGWTFVIWGGLHGIYLVVNHQWRKHGIPLPIVLNWFLTFAAVVAAWVFFRADTVQQALAILYAMINIGGFALPIECKETLGFLQGIGIPFTTFQWEGSEEIYVVLLLSWVLYSWRNTQERIADFKANRLWLIGLIVIFLVCLLQIGKGIKEFLYFQF
jgi:alginate O-acetyltransferase complex protein AlgI